MGVCGFFLQVKFVTSLLALLARGIIFVFSDPEHVLPNFPSFRLSQLRKEQVEFYFFSQTIFGFVLKLLLAVVAWW